MVICRGFESDVMDMFPGGQVLILINILDTFFIDIDLVLFY